MVLQAALYAPHLHSWSLVASAPSMLLLLRRVLVALREERENPREYGMPTMGLQVAAVHLNLLKVLYLRKHSGSRIVDTHRNSPTHDSLERAGCWQSHQIYNQPLSITPGGSFDHWGVGGFPLPQGRIFLVPTPVLLGSLVRHVHL